MSRCGAAAAGALSLALAGGCAWVSGPCEVTKGLASTSVRCERGGRVLIMPASSIEALGDAAHQNDPLRHVPGPKRHDQGWPDP